MTVITHFLFAKSVDNFAGTKEEPPDVNLISANIFVTTGIGDVFMQDKKPIDYFRMIFEVGSTYGRLGKMVHSTEQEE